MAGDVAAFVQRRSVRRQRDLGVGQRDEHLVVDVNLGSGAARLLRMVGGDERNRLAPVADGVDCQDRLVGYLQAVDLATRHVLMRQHRPHTG